MRVQADRRRRAISNAATGKELAPIGFDCPVAIGRENYQRPLSQLNRGAAQHLDGADGWNWWSRRRLIARR